MHDGPRAEQTRARPALYGRRRAASCLHASAAVDVVVIVVVMVLAQLSWEWLREPEHSNGHLAQYVWPRSQDAA